ncbi:inositol monophosphatase family protein [Nocardioides jiangxiensis]|uniref:Inositol monophosphatase family protein n=1 Tax=Nocardioides jiangxiensis TaxID=3064524 RepID=A0ABT9AWT5_9ACTN|nr:inositol monophosphatase family protein [Nocardioides sp. WY-20]MDO7866945.1 inositol monophosphatase family protein [Nocardioides sp. WY-20]
MDDLRADLQLAATLVREAGHLAASMRAEGLAASHKTSLSDIVTAADHAAEAHVVARLRAFRPDDSILGEEGAAHQGTSGRTWVIDPVDGTWNFFHGLDWWCSAIALTTDDDVVLGAIHHPATDTTYAGGPGHPATRDGLPLASLGDLGVHEVCAATYLHPDRHTTPVGAAWRRAVARPATLRVLGSGSMDAVAVATGILGVSFQHDVPLWDRLPGEALVRSLGGVREEVEAGGVTWNVLGLPTAAGEVVTALRDER